MTVDDLGRRILGWTANSRSLTLVILGCIGIFAYVTRIICLYMLFVAVVDLFIHMSSSSVHAIPDRHHKLINACLIIWNKFEDWMIALFTYIADMLAFKPDWYILTFGITVALAVGLVIKYMSDASQGDTLTQVRADAIAHQLQ